MRSAEEGELRARLRPRRTDDLSWPEGFGASRSDRAALAALLSLPSLSARRLLELAQDVGSASACLRAVKAGRAGTEADRAAANAVAPDEVARRVDAVGARLVPAGEEEYPPELLELFDPPGGLFVRGGALRRGDQEAGSPPRVAVVGARNCSPAGREVAWIIGRGLASRGVCVVSGGARGIDAASHEGALAAGDAGRQGPGDGWEGDGPEGGARPRTPTVAVLGSGIDVPYPRDHRALLEAVARAGSLVSEYGPGVRARPFRFPARNRIVAGLARAVVVVEGARGSGALITADHALDLGRSVFAVPGPVTSELSWAPLELIRDGATMIRGAEDLLHDLDLVGPADPPGGGRDLPAALAGHGPSSPVVAVWRAMAGPTPADVIARATGLPLPEVMAALLALELQGLASSSGGRHERRIPEGRAR